MDTTKTFSSLNRIEDKFVITKDQLSFIEWEVKKHLVPSYPDKTTNYTLIRSMYLDSPHLAFFRQHIAADDFRLKVRVRKYGPNGVWKNDEVYLEIKQKVGHEVNKLRMRLDVENQVKIEKGEKLQINPMLEHFNQKLLSKEEIEQFISDVNTLIDTLHIKPVVAIQYKRLAFQKGATRVTLDTGIEWEAMPNSPVSQSEAVEIKKLIDYAGDWSVAEDYGNKYKSIEDGIMEIKHNLKSLPPWLDKVKKNYLLESTNFSKYAYSATHLLNFLLKGSVE